MIQHVTFSRFCDRFQEMDRGDNFTYEGKRALYDYLTSLEDDTGEPVELDVIAFCCEFSEWTADEAEEEREDCPNFDDYIVHQDASVIITANY